MLRFKDFIKEDTDSSYGSNPDFPMYPPQVFPPGPPNPPGSINPGGPGGGQYGRPDLPFHQKYNPNGYTPGINPRRARPRNPERLPYRGNRVDNDSYQDPGVGFEDVIDYVVPSSTPFILPYSNPTQTAPMGPGGSEIMYPAPWDGPNGWTIIPPESITPPPGWWYDPNTQKWNYRPNPAGGPKDPDGREYDYTWDPKRHRWFPNSSTVGEDEPWYISPRQQQMYD